MTRKVDESSAGKGDELAQAQPEESGSQYVETDGQRALAIARSPDGRHRVPNPNGLTRDELRDVGTLLDSQIAGSVAEGPGNNGDAHTLAALRRPYSSHPPFGRAIQVPSALLLSASP